MQRMSPPLPHIHLIFACAHIGSLGSFWCQVVLQQNGIDFQAPSKLPLPTADSITSYLLLSVVLLSMLLHMTRVMPPARDDRGAREKKICIKLILFKI